MAKKKEKVAAKPKKKVSKKKSAGKADKKPRAKKKKTRASAKKKETTVVLPIRDLVAFPSVMMSLYIGRESDISAVESAMEEEKLVFVVAQKNQEVEEPGGKDLYNVGVIANVVRTLRLPEGRYKVLLQGIGRGKASGYKFSKTHMTAMVASLPLDESAEVSEETEEVMMRIRENLQTLVEYEHLPEEMLLVTEEVSSPGVLSDIILAHYKLNTEDAQELLEEVDPVKRLEKTDELIADDINQFVISENIKDKARDELSKGQKEYYLREQIRQIQRELGEEESPSEDLAWLKMALAEAKLPDYASSEANRLFKRIERMPLESSEYALIRTYLEWIADLPWAVSTKDRLNLEIAKKVLDEDHYGLDKVKDRILEYLSVRKLKNDSKGPILCFVGPPGVGKTSLGRSVARALNRKFFRVSLGGVRDEAEIRGHRRTYVGALPGRIVQGLKQAGTNNPVILFDELDKVGADFRGDPASALLEVLDPEQNKEFSDHYLNMAFDLSNAIFIATANTIDTIPGALLDRLEVIQLSGYTTEEKQNIARRFLIPRQLHENGLTGKKVRIDDKALRLLIERYTQEAGVRNLDREIASICRKIARSFAESKKMVSKISPAEVKKMLGMTKYDPEAAEQNDLVGLVRGLAWTIYGGEIMLIEASVAKGKGNLHLTGQLGSVMQESAKASVFYARSNAEELGLDPDFHEKLDIHVHLPAGATPKDGPSAGITIVTALVSALTGKKISKDFALTGEVTLRGNVLPIGGLKEKAIAALRYGIKKIIIPFDNLKDLEDIPLDQRKQIRFIPVKYVSEVLDMVLIDEKKLKRKAGARGPSRQARI